MENYHARDLVVDGVDLKPHQGIKLAIPALEMGGEFNGCNQ